MKLVLRLLCAAVFALLCVDARAQQFQPKQIGITGPALLGNSASGLGPGDNILLNSTLQFDGSGKLGLANAAANSVLCNATGSAASPIGCTTLPSGLTIPSPTISGTATFSTSIDVGPVSGYAPTNGYGGSASPNIFSVLGSSGSPDSTTNPVSIWQKWSSYTGGDNETTIYSSIYHTTNAPGSQARAGFFEAQDTGGWSGTGSNSFVEGIKANAFLSSTASLGSAYGGVFAAYNNPGVQYTYLIGNESSAQNDYADAPSSFSGSSFAAAYDAGNGGNHAIDAYYTIGPFPASGGSAIRGFYVPESANANNIVTACAFCSDNTVADVLDGPSKNIRILPGGAIFESGTTAPTLNANGQGAFYANANNGAVVSGFGANFDVILGVSAAAAALGVVHNSQEVELFGQVNAPNLVTSAGTCKGTLRIDTTGNIYINTGSGSCA